MNIKNYLLFDNRGVQVEFHKSPHQSAGISQLYLVIHYTVFLTVDHTVTWFLNPNTRVSAHLVIGRDGGIVQTVTFDRRAWHAGESKWGEHESLNQYSIGIELVNAGKLRTRADSSWISWKGDVIPDNEVTLARHKHEDSPTGWHEYTDVQIDTALRVASAMHSKYRFVDILGHDDISPGRKTDPGPLFPMRSFKSRVLSREINPGNGVAGLQT